MSWIKYVKSKFSVIINALKTSAFVEGFVNEKTTKVNVFKGNDQQKLMLIVCTISYSITASALFIADISGYLIAFILIVLALLSIYALVTSKQNSEYQIRTLANLIESMIDGDYSLRGRLQTNRAYQELLNLINNLAETLASHKIEAKESRLLLERIMEQMDAMVLATDELGQVVMANASASKLILANATLNRNAKLIQKVRLNATSIGALIENAETGLIEFNHQQVKGEHFLFKEAFLSEGKRHQLYLVTNAERLLMEKERKAWQSLLRVLSHEMNNSLTPIAAISQSMQKKLVKSLDENSTEKFDEKNKQSFLEGITIINERAESLSTFIASYSQLSHLPTPNKSKFSLISLLEPISNFYPTCQFNINACDDVMIEADKAQFEQVLINIFKNAVEAMSVNEQQCIDISSEKEGQWQHLSITDHGSGIANLDNLFVPFYTTKNHGSGIGLTLCRQIMFNHHGLIKINNNAEKTGAQVTLSLPLSMG